MATAPLRLDKMGRVLLPKKVREKLQLSPGDELAVDTSENAITLRPVRGGAQLKKKRGIWVFHSGEPISADTVRDTIDQIRTRRDKDNLEPSR